MTHVATELSVGQSGRVARVAGSDDVARRLLEMGVTPGVELRRLGAAPLGDPLEFELRGYRLSLRRSEAQHIELKLNLNTDYHEDTENTEEDTEDTIRDDDRRYDTSLARTVFPQYFISALRVSVPCDYSVMSTARPAKTIRVALIGNPNTGKSTLFTALAGVRQRVGNYPGVTVEKKTGHLQHDGQRVRTGRLARHLQPGAAVAGRNGDGRSAARATRQLAAARRGAVHRRRQQSRAQPVSRKPGAFAGSADGGGAEHGRSGPRPTD